MLVQIEPSNDGTLSKPLGEYRDEQTKLVLRKSGKPIYWSSDYWSARNPSNISQLAVGDTAEEAIGKWYWNYQC